MPQDNGFSITKQTKPPLCHKMNLMSHTNDSDHQGISFLSAAHAMIPLAASHPREQHKRTHQRKKHTSSSHSALVH